MSGRYHDEGDSVHAEEAYACLPAEKRTGEIERLIRERRRLNRQMERDAARRSDANFKRRDEIDRRVTRIAESDLAVVPLPAVRCERKPLEAWKRHVERFGPDLVLESAARELRERELGELKAFIESKQRSHYWQAGRAGGPDSHWRERREKATTCDHCGLDLPVGSGARRRFHSHCRVAAYRASRATRSVEAL
jgi:hypothetical protein